MGLRINTNVPSLQVQRNLEASSKEIGKSFQRLSSGNRIAQASDDGAGLGIAANLKAQIRGMKQAQRNASDGISLVQTAEGSLNETSNILIRLRELGIQAANDSLGEHERVMIDREYQTLKEEVDRIAKTTKFNGQELLSGEGKELSFQVGPHGDLNNVIRWSSGETNATAKALDIDSLTVNEREAAHDSLAYVDNAINKINDYRASLGAMQNRLHSAVNTMGSMSESYSEARSRIADTDVAEESSRLMKNSILQNAGIAVLAQANAAPQAATRLL